MNEPNPVTDDALSALFARARSQRRDTSRAEYAFETRLLARLQNRPDNTSVWEFASWRLIPIFAVCVMALAVWHSEVVAEASDAEQMAYVENPGALESLDNLN